MTKILRDGGVSIALQVQHYMTIGIANVILHPVEHRQIILSIGSF